MELYLASLSPGLSFVMTEGLFTQSFYVYERKCVTHMPWHQVEVRGQLLVLPIFHLSSVYHEAGFVDVLLHMPGQAGCKLLGLLCPCLLQEH